MPLTHGERMLRAIEFNKERKAGIFVGQIATKDKIKLEELSTEEIDRLVSIYDEWKTGVSYSLGDLVAYKDSLFEVVQAHVSQEDWAPDITPALFKSFTPVSVIAEWVQPTGAHDAYDIGDQVIYNGTIWTSIITANTTIPNGDEPFNRYWEPQI